MAAAIATVVVDVDFAFVGCFAAAVDVIMVVVVAVVVVVAAIAASAASDCSVFFTVDTNEML